MPAKLYLTRRPDRPYQVVFTDPLKREKSGRAKRIVKWFREKKEAVAELEKLNEKLVLVGTAGIQVFDHELRADALGARDVLRNAGINSSLIELAQAEVRRRARSNTSALADAAQAVEQFLEDKRRENCAFETVDDHAKRLRRWIRLENISVLGDITPERVQAARNRAGMSVKSRRNDLNSIRVFCKWAVLERKLMSENPAAEVRGIKTDKRRPVAWSPEEAERFMRSAEGYRGGAFVPAVVARVFAGLRPSEMRDSRLVRDGDAWVVRVEGGKLRGRANRVVPLQPNAVAWLRRFPAGKDGRLPHVSAFCWRALRKAADAPGMEPIVWVNDVARHSFISYRLAAVKNDGQVALEAGNSPDEIFKSYYHLRTESEARAFWGIMPAKAGRGNRVARSSAQNSKSQNPKSQKIPNSE